MSLPVVLRPEATKDAAEAIGYFEALAESGVKARAGRTKRCSGLAGIIVGDG